MNIDTPIRNQRPYASLFFIQTSISSTDFLEKNALTSELTLGAWGLPLGHWLQASIHGLYRLIDNSCDTCKPYCPKGWHNQISNHGEPTGLYSITYKRKLDKSKPRDDAFEVFDAFASANLSVGFYNGIEGTITARHGFIRSAWWTFNSYPFGQAANGVYSKQRGRFFKNRELYVYATFRPSLMFYSVSLQGQFRKNIYDLSSDQVKHGILQGEAGFVFSVSNKFTINAQLAYRTKLHKLEKSKVHSWFGIYLTFHTPFPDILTKEN